MIEGRHCSGALPASAPAPLPQPPCEASPRLLTEPSACTGRMDPYCKLNISSQNYQTSTHTDGGKNPVRLLQGGSGDGGQRLA